MAGKIGRGCHGGGGRGIGLVAWASLLPLSSRRRTDQCRPARSACCGCPTFFFFFIIFCGGSTVRFPFPSLHRAKHERRRCFPCMDRREGKSGITFLVCLGVLHASLHALPHTIVESSLSGTREGRGAHPTYQDHQRKQYDEGERFWRSTACV